MYRIALIIYSVFISFSLLAQTNFLAKGDASFAEGTYSEAVKQYNAQIAVYDSKEMSKTSEEYVQATRRLSTAQRCQELLSSLMQKFSEAKKYGTRQKYDIAIEDARALLKLNPGDKTALECSRAYSSVVSEISSNADWEKTKDENTLEAYRDYLSRLKGDAHRAEALAYIIALEEQELWERTLAEGTREAFVRYLNDSEQGIHKEDAEGRIARIDSEALWKKAQEQNTETAYQDYLENSQDLSHEKEAREALASLQEQSLWERTLTLNTYEAYQKYLTDTELGLHKAEAEEKIEKEKFWVETLAQDTEEAYIKYLDTSQDTTYFERAREAVVRLSDAKFWLVVRKQFENELIDMDEIRLAAFQRLTSVKKSGAKFDEGSQNFYKKLKEKCDYDAFRSSPNIERGLSFLKEFPHSSYKAEVSDLVALLYATSREYSSAFFYAVSDECVNRIKQMQRKQGRGYIINNN